jgi:hypothetical protein
MSLISPYLPLFPSVSSRLRFVSQKLGYHKIVAAAPTRVI